MTDTILEFCAIPHLLYHLLHAFFNRFLNRNQILHYLVPLSNRAMLKPVFIELLLFSATSFGKRIFFSSLFTFKVKASQYPLFFYLPSKKQAHLSMLLSAYASSIELDNFAASAPSALRFSSFAFFANFRRNEYRWIIIL